MRSFNVFSERIVIGPGETFEFAVNLSEVGTGNGIGVTVYGITLDPPGPYNVAPHNSVTVTAPSAAAQGTITCSPVALGVGTQNIIVASLMADICNDVEVNPGDYFIWQNKHNNPVVIKADPTNINDWPLPDEEHEVPANGWLPLQMPIDAIPNDEDNPPYGIKLTMNGTPFNCDPTGTQPRIIVGSSK